MRAAVFIAGLAACLAAALFLLRCKRCIPTRTLPYPAERPVSLAVRDGQYVSFDRSSRELVRLESDSGLVVERQAFPIPDVAALSVNKSCIWSVDPVGRKIHRHHPDSCAILEVFPSPGPEPSAVFSDGETLWTADRTTGRVYRHAKSGGLAVLDQSPIREKDPVDLLRAEDRLWVLDGSSSRVGRYRLGTPLAPEGSASLADCLPAGAAPVGFALEGRWLWVMTRNPSSLHRVDLRALRFSSR